jgi:pyruvate/2-oxoglutarate dehydrogenase complex dihydrolipoamide acyltransferase (E2) component
MLAFLMKAAVAALKKYPEFNSSLDGDDLILKKYFNIGFAADTPTGLVVPVIKDADKKGIFELAKETSDLAALARDGKLKAYHHDGFWKPMDTLNDKNKLEDIWSKGGAPWKVWG